MDVDALTAADPLNRWRFWLILAAFFPVILLVGGLVWFVRANVPPPMAAIPPQPILASAETAVASPIPRVVAPVAEPPPSSLAQSPSPEPPQAPSPFPAAPPQVAELFSAPPATPGSSRLAIPNIAPASEPLASATANPEVAVADEPPEAAVPIAGPIPLPRRRPRVSLASMRGPVPLPKPRPEH